MSSRAWVVDLIHSIGEKTALVDHLEEQIGTESTEQIEKIIERTLSLRREQMSLLLSNGEKPNPHYWCPFKHSVKAWVQDTEIYEATLTPETREQMVISSEILASMTSLFLGMEFETCARCLYDQLLVKQAKKEKETK